MKSAAYGLLAGVVAFAAGAAPGKPELDVTPLHLIEPSLTVFAGAKRIDPRLRSTMNAAVQKDGLFDVIINLDPGQYRNQRALEAAFGTPGALRALRGKIRSTQNRAIAALGPQARQRVVHRYENVFAFSARLTTDEIQHTAQIAEVDLIEERPTFQLMDSEAHALTGIDQAQSLGYTGAGTVIAIIDDGIDHDHPAFGGQSSWPNSKILGGYDFADNDSNPRIDCLDQSHGTAVAGVATGNGGGVMGSAPDAQFVFLKVQASSECGQPSLSGDVAAAIDWAVSNRDTYGIDIISMSLGGGAYASTCDSASTAYRNAVTAANSQGMVILAASGNDGLCNEISHPSCMTDVISVGAVYDSAMGSSGSCVSPNSCGNTQSHQVCAQSGLVACFDDSAADGVTCYSNSASFLDILAPSNCATTAATGGGIESCFSGTSSATPYAAGVAATLIEAAGGSGALNNDDMRNLLRSSGVNVVDTKNSRSTPRVDAQAAIDALDGGTEPPPSGDDVLSNGVPVTGLAAADSVELHFTMEVPSNAEDLVFQISGGTGDADLYTRYGAAPTTQTWECRPYAPGNSETCSEPNPAVGTWYVMVRAYDPFSGVTLVGSYATVQPNQAPTADFTYSSDDLTASFNDTSSDSDGSIVSRAWNFGDGSSSSSANPNHTYAAEGTYTVTLTVTDDDGASDQAAGQVSVTAPAGGPCGVCEAYSGSLSGSGDSDAHPDGTYYYASSGTHQGYLEGPGNADFDLELYRWSNGWKKVAQSVSGTSSEEISYNGTAGYYYWRILSYSGSGSYDFYLDRP